MGYVVVSVRVTVLVTALVVRGFGRRHLTLTRKVSNACNGDVSTAADGMSASDGRKQREGGRCAPTVPTRVGARLGVSARRRGLVALEGLLALGVRGCARAHRDSGVWGARGSIPVLDQ